MTTERQLCEAPSICVVVKYDPLGGGVAVVRFTDENDTTLALPGQPEFDRLMSEYAEEIEAAKEDCADEAGQKWWYEDSE